MYDDKLARIRKLLAQAEDPAATTAEAEAFNAKAAELMARHGVDATLLAPRQTLVRIATGRDAADTAFLDNHKGSITLNYANVTAVVDGDLPVDDVEELVSIR